MTGASAADLGQVAQVALGDQMLSAAEFEKLVRGLRGIVKIKGQFVYLDDREISRLLLAKRRPKPIS